MLVFAIRGTKKSCSLQPGVWLLLLGIGFPVLAGQEITVKDQLERTVQVPGRVERVLSLQPEVTRIIAALGAGQSLVGRDDFIARSDHLFPLIYPPQSQLPVAAASDGTPNLELVMRLSPDIIFVSPSEGHIADSLQQKTGKPVLALSSMGRFEQLLNEIRWVGAVLGRAERAAELETYILKTLERVRRAVADIPMEQRPRVYISFWSNLTRTPVFYEPVNIAGGRNLAEGLLPAYLGTVGVDVSLEKILEWDPDMILLHGNYLPAERKVTTSGVLQDPRLRSLLAVKENKVFYTFGFWYWWDPAQVLIETQMLAKLFHPERFRDFDLAREGNAVLKKFYGVDKGFDALRRRLDFHDWPWR